MGFFEMKKMESIIILAIVIAVIVISLVFVAMYPDGPPAAHGEGDHDEGGANDTVSPHDAAEDGHAAEAEDLEPATDDHAPAEAH